MKHMKSLYIGGKQANRVATLESVIEWAENGGKFQAGDKLRSFIVEGGVGKHMVQTVVYARVSTQDQDLEHQKQNLWEYTTDTLGVPPSDITVLEDKSTGTNTDRSGYRKMLKMIREGEAEQVVVREITRLGRAMREISENVHELVDDHNAGIHVMKDDIDIEPGGDLNMRDKMLLSVLAWAAELEVKKIRENTKAGLKAAREAGKWTKRPPYGFTTDDDGYLQPNEDFSKARSAILAIEEEGFSQRKASRHTGVPRRTIANILDRKDWYLEGEYTEVNE